IGFITSAIWSPRLRANVAHAMVSKEFCNVGQKISIHITKYSIIDGTISSLPFQ
ncbi:MAG: dimethylsulfoniopropionate demethylase, partial [Rhodobacteraceae bacterium]|nr:dimethylsulfoniopropionate demethylase [Paracoccaceae bacterium]